MPRSDDWTIHMPQALIKRGARADFPRMSSKQSHQPLFASLCPASLIRAGNELGGGVIGGFEAQSAARFFFAEGAADWRAALPRHVARGQPVDMFVELT